MKVVTKNASTFEPSLKTSWAAPLTLLVASSCDSDLQKGLVPLPVFNHTAVNEECY